MDICGDLSYEVKKGYPDVKTHDFLMFHEKYINLKIGPLLLLWLF